VADQGLGPSGVNNGMVRLLTVLGALVRDVGFPIAVAAWLLYAVTPRLDELIILQARGNEVLRSLGTRSCTLPFQQWEPAPGPRPGAGISPSAWRNLGLRHGDPIDWFPSNPNS